MQSLFFQESPYLFIFITLSYGILYNTFFPYDFMIFIYAITIFSFLLFYRVPIRINNYPPNILVAPCDGRVLSITNSTDGFTHIVVYLNLFDVHVQWYPIQGCITDVNYKKGSFNFAHLLEKSKYNERLEMTIYSPLIKNDIKVIQIAGQVVRRIVNFTKEGDVVQRGNLYGMIKLSSRVDIIIPTKNIQLHIKNGDKIYGNHTSIGELFLC